MKTNCKNCGACTSGCTGLCQTCRSAKHHAVKRIRAEQLTVDTAGGSWWVWDTLGNVLAMGDSWCQAVCALHLSPE